jgi:hypothetical protein
MHKRRMVFTLQSCDSFALSRLLPDTLDHGWQEAAHVALDLVVGVSRHEDMCIGIQALCAAICAAAFGIADLLHACVELCFPGRFGDLSIFAVDDIVDGVGAGKRALAHCSRKKHDVTCLATQVLEECQTHLQAVPSLKESSLSSDIGRPRVRLAARDCAGDAVVEPALDVAPEATREAVFFDTVLWLSRARLRRSRIVK